MALKIASVLCRLGAPQFQADQALAQCGVFSIHQAPLDQLQEARNGRLRLLVGMAQLDQPLAVLVLAVRSGTHVSLQHFPEAVRLKDAPGHLPDDNLVKAIHWACGTLGRPSPPPSTCGSSNSSDRRRPCRCSG